MHEMAPSTFSSMPSMDPPSPFSQGLMGEEGLSPSCDSLSTSLKLCVDSRCQPSPLASPILLSSPCQMQFSGQQLQTGHLFSSPPPAHLSMHSFSQHPSTCLPMLHDDIARHEIGLPLSPVTMMMMVPDSTPTVAFKQEVI